MISYNTTDDPTERGVYACRVPHELPGLYKDEFLSWINGKWGYLGSDQNYRGEVIGWIGPLQRRMNVA
jgi:hypothetical protein